ncbi:MAG TPA: multidrug efflux RND transporter permease subunit [Tepidisphaeraceae bacterium]|jgi:multidrug efflux pump|nr:multidrug efflux RND transporter permease subunit [Tepidisphaeraceae bacterium]
MSLSSPFIHRPVATTLLTIAIALAGILSYFYLPVSPLPQVEFPTISVAAQLPGASPETMASAVATPLEREFGRIAGVTEMTSTSTLSVSSVTLQFDLNRNIDAAARDVQAAINAARGQLPTNLPSNPTYRKVNPADAPILILSLTSASYKDKNGDEKLLYDRGPMYDAGSSILQQKLSQVEGVGQVFVGGGALPAVRVNVNPTLLNNFGLGLEDVRSALSAANANSPKGQIQDAHRTYTIAATDQLLKAKDYRPMIIRYRNGAPIKLGQVADVEDSIEDVHTGGLSDGKPAVMMVIFRQPGANIIETVDRVIAMIPQLQAEVPAGMHLEVAMDRTTTIRASVHDVEITLLISLSLVILVVFLFLRNIRATFIPSIVVPVSLIGTFGVMYLMDYSIDNLSLMALTICTGFVVDDAIVVIENIMRHLEEGMQPMQAALKGAREIGFTVLSISVSLVAVFLPILMLGGIVGRLFREFAVVLTVAILVSLVVSLTTTPMMCAKLLKAKAQEHHGRVYRFTEGIFVWVLDHYEWTLSRVLRHPLITLIVTLLTIVFTVVLYVKVPKGFFPQQDTGRLMGSITADQDTSFQAMKQLLAHFCQVVGEDKDVTNVAAFMGGNGGGALNTARAYITLRPMGQRKDNAGQVIGRLRKKLAQIPGATMILQSVQDLRIGGRMSSALYQFSLQGDDLNELKTWAPQVLDKMKGLNGLVDVSSDQQDHGLSELVQVDRNTANRMGISQAAVDGTLYDAFGQRQVSVTYTSLNQYHVVMVVPASFSSDPGGLHHLYVESPSGKQIPLNAIAKPTTTTTSLAVNHSGQFPCITISFNLTPGFSLGAAVLEIQDAERDMGLPTSIHGNFAGTAQAYQTALQNEPILIGAALLTVYIVLGILYESYIHPITIISTLPSAGVGALLALMICGFDLDVMGMIGIVLLIGIVKKNAIMMVDFALEQERNHGKSPKDAIFQACLMRFRPIIMTTMAALLGALPLAIGAGTGAEMRQPLGVAIVGGLIFSQILTLYTTPVVYLYLDRLRLWFGGGTEHARHVLPLQTPGALPG